MTLTIKRPMTYATEQQWDAPKYELNHEQTLPVGTKLEYVAHIPGGMVKAKHDGQVIVIHPGCTEELK